MIFKYKKELIIITASIFVCLFIFACIRFLCFKNIKVNAPIDKVIKYYNEEENIPKYKVATVKPTTSTTTLITTISKIQDEEEVIDKEEKVGAPYEVAPVFEDDGSIIYDGLTLTELTEKLNRSLKGYLKNTGYFFANYTKNTGIDPYLAVSIALHETGCKYTCSYNATNNNNFGGLMGSNGYLKYATIDEGLNSYLGIIYNNYHLKGLDTAEKMGKKYAADPEWANKINRYIEEVKNA